MLSKIKKLTTESYKAEMTKFPSKDYLRLMHELAYDLRSRVSPILAGVKVLQADNLPENKREAFLNNIQTQAMSLLAMIDAISQYAEDRLVTKD